MLKHFKQLKNKQIVQFITGPHKHEYGIILDMHSNKSKIQVGDIDNPGVPKFNIRDRFSHSIDQKTKQKIKVKKKQNGYIDASNVKIITNYQKK